MSSELETQGPPDACVALTTPLGGLPVSRLTEERLTLGALPVGARLVMRCRKDWRTAAIVERTPEAITLTVHSPSGHTYRLRRPPETELSFDGAIPLIGEGCWRAALVRYDRRW